MTLAYRLRVWWRGERDVTRVRATPTRRIYEVRDRVTNERFLMPVEPIAGGLLREWRLYPWEEWHADLFPWNPCP